MNIRIVTACMFLLLSVAAKAQQGDDYYVEGDSAIDKNEKATSVHLTTGTSVSSDFHGGTAFSTYVAPFVTHQLNPRWKISLGAALVNSNFNNWKTYSLDDSPSVNGNLLYQQMFVRADYQASDKIVLSGAVYHHLLTLNAHGSASSLTLPGNTYMLGMEYHLARGVTLGIQVSQSRGYGFQTPYSPFSSGFGSYGSFGPYNSFGSYGTW